MSKLKIIALEEHTINQEIAKATEKAIGKSFPNIKYMNNPSMTALPKDGSLLDLGQRRIADMDAQGIDMQIISYSNQSQLLPTQEAPSLTKNANDMLADAVNSYPDRFGGFATLPWSTPEEAAKELERSVKTLGLKGALITGRPSADAKFLDDTKYWPILEACASLNVPLYVHPGFPCQSLQQDYYGNLTPLVSTALSLYGWGWHAEAGIQIIRMILSGVFDKYPDLKIIAGHWGEMVPFFLDRLDMAIPKNISGLKKSIPEYFKEHVYITPSGMFSYPQLQFIMDTLSIDKILYSVDYPYVEENNAAKFLEDAPISMNDKNKIAHENAEKLLNL